MKSSRKPRKQRAMGWVVATAVAATPAIGCEDRSVVGFGNLDAGSQMEAAASMDTASNADTTMAMDTGSQMDATPGNDTVPGDDAGGLDALDDASHDAYADGIRG